VTDAVGNGNQIAKQKVCFLACPIGSPGSPERKRSDLLKTYVIEEVIKPLGYEIRRSDEIDRSGEITTQIVTELIDADLVIADLTGHNANVFYELGVRHSFKLPYIQLIEDGQDIPFDVKAYRTIFLNHTDLESVAKAKATLKNMIIDIEQGGEIQSPITKAVERQRLQSSGDPEERGFAQIAASLERVELRLRRIENAWPRPVITGNLAEDKLASALLTLYNQAGTASGDVSQETLIKWILDGSKDNDALQAFIDMMKKDDKRGKDTDAD
jgi:hypothetical protein